MKKILFIYHTSSIGGGSYCLLNILKNINRAQIQPFVLLSDDGPLVEDIKKLEIDVYFLSRLRTVPYNTTTLKPKSINNAINIILSLKELKNIIKQINVDIVYCNSMMLYPYLKPAKESGCKTIIHIREHWPEKEHKWQRNKALSYISKYADEIIAINRFSASMLEAFGRKATIVYDWIDLSTRFEEIPLDKIFNEDMKDKKTFLYLGGMQKIKGALEVLKAFNSLPNNNYRLLALGINIQYQPTGLRRCVKELLKLLGFKSYSERVIDIAKSDKRIKCISGIYNIRHLYEQAYCVLSYFTIPHANLSLAESIICNTVNIAACNDESLEYSLEGDLAILYKENSYEDFLNKIKELESHFDDYQARMIEKSNRIEYMFEPKRNIEILNNIIKNC